MAIAVLDEYQNMALSAPSVAVDIASNDGDTLVALVAANSFGASAEVDCRISSVIDDAHNTWVPGATGFAVGAPSEPETAVRVAIWFCTGAGAATKVTATATQTCDSMTIDVVKLSGVTNIAPLDEGDGNAILSGTDVTADLVTTNNQDVVIALAATGDTGKTLTHDADTWTPLTNVDTFGEADPDNGLLMRSAYLIQTTAGVQSTSWTLAPAGAAAWAAIALKDGTVDTTNPNPFWPQITHELAFGYDPNDPEAVPVHTDVTNRVLSFTTRRGRDYELTRVEAGEADVRMRNDDGALNPENLTSPYYPNVRLMTPYRIRAKWNGQTHSIFSGYVERWPQLWDEQYGTSPMQAVDGLATLSATRLAGTIGSEILADEPHSYWPLDDGRLAQDAANKAPNNTKTLGVEVSAASGGPGGSGFFGADLDVAGEESTCWEQVIHSTFNPSADSQFGACLTATTTLPQLSPGILIECWAKIPATTAPAAARKYVLLALKASTFAAGDAHRVVVLSMDSQSGVVTVEVAEADGDMVANSGSGAFNNDQWHHFVVFTTNDSVQLWIDGTEHFNAVLASTTSEPIDAIYVGGIQDADESKGFTQGRFAHIAVFALSESDPRRVAVRANAGLNGFSERSGSRIARLLNYAGWTAGRAVDTGLSLLGSAATIARQTLLQAVQDVANWENGLAFVDSNGMFRFVDRNGRFFEQTKWVFGDANDSSEIPYETDVEIQYDPKYVYNDVTITKNAGRTSAGGGSAHARDQASIKTYFTRTLDKTTGVSAIPECEAEAAWTLENYAQPRLRLAHITITPSANPDLWPVALSAEIGDRVTVRRRPFGGELIELDCYIEQVNHQVMPNKWTVTFSLSPVLLTTYSSVDAWVLGSSTLDEDTFLG